MARSSTTFQKGHTKGFKPGNKLALRHGMFSPAIVEEKMGEIRERVNEVLAQNLLVQPGDSLLVDRYRFLSGQVLLGVEFYERNGGMYTRSGNLKKGAMGFLQLCDRLEKLDKTLGVGPLPRADVAQKMAGAQLGAVEVRAALERLRRPKLAVVAGSE